MAFQLERFRITGLHGVRTVDISITDNKLILVGENGTGKTTIANLICFFSRDNGIGWHLIDLSLLK